MDGMKKVTITIDTIESELWNITHLNRDEMTDALERGILEKLIEVKLANKAGLFGKVKVEMED